MDKIELNKWLKAIDKTCKEINTPNTIYCNNFCAINTNVGCCKCYFNTPIDRDLCDRHAYLSAQIKIDILNRAKRIIKYVYKHNLSIKEGAIRINKLMYRVIKEHSVNTNTN